jgi:hypothetical protein
MSGPVMLTRFARDTFAALSRAWSQVWFQDSPTSPLELTRIGVGAALLLHYALATPHLFDLWGDAGWMPRDVVLMIRDPWMQSIFYYFGAPWEWVAFHGLFLLCCAALSAVTGCRNASSSKDRFAEALVFRLAAQGAICEPGGKSIVCLVPDVNENQSRYLSRSLTLAIIPA